MRMPRFSLGAVLILVAVVPLALDLARRWMIDPSSCRLPAGSEAVLDPNSSGYVDLFPSDGDFVSAEFGSRVRVLSDAEPSQIGLAPDADGTTTMGENRHAKITVLDGEKAGSTGETLRTYLRPVPCP
jgi:hypothetical protein